MQALRSKFLVTPLASHSTPLAEPGELLPVNTWEISQGRVLAREPLRIEWPTSCFSTPGDGMPGPDDAGHSSVIVQPGEDISRFVVALSGVPGTLAGGGHGGGGGHYGGGGHGGGGHGGGHGGGGTYGRHGGRWGWGGWGGYGGWGWGGWPVYAYGWPAYEDWQQRPRGVTVPEAIAYLTQQYGAEEWYRGAVGGVSPSGLEVVQVFVSSSEGARVLPARVGPFTVVVTVKTSNPTVGMLAGCSACVGGGFQGVIKMPPRKAAPPAVAAPEPEELDDEAVAENLRASGVVVSLGAVASKSQSYAGPTNRIVRGDQTYTAAPPAMSRFPAGGSSAPPSYRTPPVGRYVPSDETGKRVPPSTRYAPPSGGYGRQPPPPPAPPPAPPSSMWPPSEGETAPPSDPSSPQLPDVSVLGPCPTPGACGPRIPLGPEIPFPRPMPSFPRQGIPCGSCKLRVAQGARMSDIAVRLGVPPQVLLDANAWKPGQTLASGEDFFVEAGEELVAPRGLAAAMGRDALDVEPSPSLVCVKQGGQWNPATGKCLEPEVTPGAEPPVEQKKSVVPYVIAGGVLLVTAGLFFGTLAIKAPPAPEPKPRQRLA